MKYFLVLVISALGLSATTAAVPTNPDRARLLGQQVLYGKLSGFSAPVDAFTSDYIKAELSSATDSSDVYVWPSPDDPMSAEVVFLSNKDEAMIVLGEAHAIDSILSTTDLYFVALEQKVLE